MKLTGQAKKDFEKWFYDGRFNIKLDSILAYEGEREEIHLDDYFYELDQSMQYGVYIDWFDSVGRAKFILHKFIKHYSEHRNIDEARDYSIEKENEIYNSK